MKKSQKSSRGRAAAKRTRVFRFGLLASILLALGVVTGLAAKHSSPTVAPSRAAQGGAPAQAASRYVTVEVGGKKVQLNALTMQQGPLTQEQSQQIADALKDNKSTEGLVEVRHADGTVEMDLQGRFQNVTLAKKNDDGSLSEACVDSPEAAAGFLNGKEATTGAEPTTRKAAMKE